MIAAGGVVRAIPAPGAAAQPRSFFDKLHDWARQDMGAPGLGYIVFEAQGGAVEGKGPIAKFIPAEVQRKIMAKAGIQAGDAVFFAADKPAAAAKLAGAARTKIGEELGLIAKDRFEFCWIVDFPMYEWNEEEKKIDFSHNPFSMPNHRGRTSFSRSIPPTTRRFCGLKAIQYDIVCNGTELSSGAIRNHRPDVMRKAFAIAGYGENTLEQKFGGMLRALSLGAPPHGGIAPGIDRIVMLLCGGGEPARGGAVPDEPARRGFVDGRAVGGLAEAAARAAYPAEFAGEGAEPAIPAAAGIRGSGLEPLAAV